jgi:acetyl esterase
VALLACVPVNRRVDTLVRRARGAVQAGALKPVTALPPAVRARLAGAPVQVDGNVLDPDMQLLLKLSGVLPDRPQWSVGGRRELMRTECQLVACPPRELRRVTDLTVRGSAGQLGARLYVPRTAGDGLLVYFHGGGWVVGDLDTHDPWLRTLADDARVRVLSVDYRLAPEAEAPAAAEDAIAAFGWAVRHAADLGADPARIAVAGDSAGGNLAAVVAQQAVRRRLTPPAFQLLIYPALDLVGRRSSRDLFHDGFLLTEPLINWYRDHYTPEPSLRSDPIVSPLLAEDLSGLPPAYIVTAGFDPLRDEGAEYAEKLAAAGVPVNYTCETAMLHGFTSILIMSDGARQARLRIAATVHDALDI